MSLRFEALEPSYELTGNAPLYKIQFIDDSNGQKLDPDSVDKLEIFDDNDNLLRSYTPPEIDNPAVGEYQVQDVTIEDPVTLELRWNYTINGSGVTTATAFEVVSEVVGGAEKQIKDHVLDELGQGRVRVEIPAGTLSTCLFKAKQWYAMHHGQQKRKEINATQGDNRYDLPDDVYYIFDVVSPNGINRLTDTLGLYGIYGLSDLGIDSIPAGGLFTPGSASGFYSSLVQSMQYAEMGQKILGNDPTWEHLKETNELIIYPDPVSSQNIIIDYVSTEVNLTNMNPQEYMFIQEYTLAETMIALGRIRGKFTGGFPAAQGQASLDGSTLRNQGQQKKDKLDDKIQQWAPSGWIIKG